jgi:alkanesulfonate monooxygenase SsuD/methylene tetrahydromethanopterin reductase-like flavin-dependent oxidoreductase (luciferase family)
MKLGMFSMPSHPPERDLLAGHNWDLEVLRLADRLGYEEAWIGEHFTSPWEPNPAPDLLIAQALTQTSRIKLAPGAHLLPYHQPAELAVRVAYMDHLAGGRYMLGIGAGGLPSDLKLFNVDAASGQHRDMVRAAIDIMLKVWTANSATEFNNQYWKGTVPDPMYGGLLQHHIKPLQKPYPPIGIAGISYRSDTLKLAGEYGFLPLSLDMNARVLRSHWEAVAEGAARAGRAARRSDWRIVRDVYVGDTDAQARRDCLAGGMGRNFREYLLPLYQQLDFVPFFKHNNEVTNDQVTVDYLLDHNWIVGSPQTVADKLAALYREVGGFGCLLTLGADCADDPEPWFKSMRLMAEEVMPRLAHLTGDANGSEGADAPAAK